jgi:hypothetical protein
MATIECRSAQRGVAPKMVQLDGITDREVTKARAALDALIESEEQVSDAVAAGFVAVAVMCPKANPSDLWQHVIYRHLLDSGWSDNRWKRVSGFALERAFVSMYESRLAPHNLRMRKLDKTEANKILVGLGTNIRDTKIDVFLEGKAPNTAGPWRVFGAAHVKSSIAERIQDDVPASQAFMSAGLVSIALTMDSKSYPPPHGECINWGELGGRSLGVDKERLKRGYVEVEGQFDGLFSFNLRTPPSPATTASGKRIYTMGLSEKQPDQLVKFLTEKWIAYAKANPV